MPTLVVPEDSEMRKRLDDYLGYRRRNMQLDDDLWKRWHDNLHPLVTQPKVKKGKYRVNRDRGEV